MRFVVDLCQVLKIQAGVYLGRRDIRVAQHVLHCTQILRRLQDMTGEAVTQYVWMQVSRQARLQGNARQLQLNHSRHDPCSACAQKQGRYIAR